MDVKSCQYFSIATQFFLVDVEKEQGSVEISPSGLAEEGNTVVSLSRGQTMYSGFPSLMKQNVWSLRNVIP